MKKLFQWLKSFLPQKQSQYIHGISFKNSHGVDFVFTIGDECVINEQTKGTVEKIEVKNSVVTIFCDSFIVRHIMHKSASLVLKSIDVNKILRDELRRFTLAAKEHSIINPILANQVIEELSHGE